MIKLNFKIVLMVIVLIFAFGSPISIWLKAEGKHYRVCQTDCGEAEIAIKAVQDYRENGLKFNLIENYGTTKNPKLYTHNVNIGNLLFIALDEVGIKSLEIKTLVVAIAFGVGLMYSFLLISLATNDKRLALIFLVLLATTFWPVLTFSLNALRAFHYWALFGLSYHAYLIWKSSTFTKLGHWLGLLIANFVAFGCGYDFWIICLIFAILLTGRKLNNKKIDRDLVKKIGVSILIILMPFIFRQIQIALTLGLEYWATDFIYTMGIKIPKLGSIFNLPSMDVIDAYYLENNILRPPAVPTNSFQQIFGTAIMFLENVTIPRWGVVDAGMPLFLVSFAIIARVNKAKNLFRSYLNLNKLKLNIFSVLLPLLTAIFFGLMILSPFSLHVYIKHEMPLLAAPILFSLALVINALFGVVFSKNIYLVFLAGLLLTLILLNLKITAERNYSNPHYLNLDYIDFISTNPGKNFYINGYLNHVGIYSSEKGVARYLPPFYAADLEELVASRGQRTTNDDVTSGDYFVYQPVEQYYFIDNGLSNCVWTDQIYDEASKVLGNIMPSNFNATWINPPNPRIGSKVFFGGTMPRSHKKIIPHFAVEKSVGDKYEKVNLETLEALSNYNCISREYVGRLNTKGLSAGSYRVKVETVTDDYRQITFAIYNFELSDDGREVNKSHSALHFKDRQPTIREVLSKLPRDSIREYSLVGIGYVIVDLKVLRQIYESPQVD